LWEETDGFYYDQVILSGQVTPLRFRSLVGVVPLLVVEVLEQASIDNLTGFKRRMEWFLRNRHDLAEDITYLVEDRSSSGVCTHRLLAIPSRERLASALRYVFDEKELFSPFGIRSLSKVYQDSPYVFHVQGQTYTVRYTPAESDSDLFGGNSNWRGPVWFPLNYLLIEALERYHHFYGESFRVECPTGSGHTLNLLEASQELARRLTRLFLPDATGVRPIHGADRLYQSDPHWKDLVLFYEYFNADTGRGAGASHQTGWTALVSRLLDPEITRGPR
jgi:hypothetical protein